MLHKFTNSDGTALYLKLSKIYCVDSNWVDGFFKSRRIQGTRLYVGNDTQRCFLVKENIDDVVQLLKNS